MNRLNVCSSTSRARFGTVRILAVAVAVSAALAFAAASALAAPNARRIFYRVNRPGNILIADQYNNRVIEIDPKGDIVWHFGLGPNDFSPASCIGCNDAQRVGPFTLMAGTGIPPGTVPNCADPSGCPDNRVMLVSPGGHIVWQYGQFGVTGSGPDELNTPVQSTWLPSGRVLITDQGNQRVIEVDLKKDILWQYGTTGVAGSGPNELNAPNSAELLEDGNVLISDENNNRTIEVDHAGNIVATFTAGGTLSGVAFSSRLPNGDTLITDSNNARIVEVDPTDTVVWQYFTNTDPLSNPSPLPSRAIRLRNGNTIISDQWNHRVFIIDRATPPNIVATYGNINVSGYDTMNASQGLFGPYDAKVIGDYTGLTPPFFYGMDMPGGGF